MSEFITALGLVFVIEGLVYALAPGGMKQLMAMMQGLPDEKLRSTGIWAIAIGVGLVWFARQVIAGS